MTPYEYGKWTKHAQSWKLKKMWISGHVPVKEPGYHNWYTHGTLQAQYIYRAPEISLLGKRIEGRWIWGEPARRGEIPKSYDVAAEKYWVNK